MTPVFVFKNNLNKGLLKIEQMYETIKLYLIHITL